MCDHLRERVHVNVSLVVRFDASRAEILAKKLAGGRANDQPARFPRCCDHRGVYVIHCRPFGPFHKWERPFLFRSTQPYGHGTEGVKTYYVGENRARWSLDRPIAGYWQGGTPCAPRCEVGSLRRAYSALEQALREPWASP